MQDVWAWGWPEALYWIGGILVESVDKTLSQSSSLTWLTRQCQLEDTGGYKWKISSWLERIQGNLLEVKTCFLCMKNGNELEKHLMKQTGSWQLLYFLKLHYLLGRPYIKVTCMALAGGPRWTECRPVNQSHQFDSQPGHMPGLRARSPVGGVWRQPHIAVSLPL